MKKIVMLFLATMVLAGASFATQATTSTDNAMKSDTMKSDSAAPKKAKKAKKEKAPKAAKTKKSKKDKAAATTEAPAATPAK